MKQTVQINLRLDVDFYEEMEKARGEKPRTTFIREAVAREIGEELPRTRKQPTVRTTEPPVEANKAEKAPLPKVAARTETAARYGCRVSGCTFTAGSPKAKCQDHPGALVELAVPKVTTRQEVAERESS